MKKLFTFMLLLVSSSAMMAVDIVVTTVTDGTGEEIPAGSFRDAVSKASSGDVIKFNATDGNMIELKATIAFAGEGKIFVIDGLNQATKQPIVLTKSSEAAENARLINIANGSGSAGLDITLKNISFEDVSASGNGACISSGNSAYQVTGQTAFNVTIENCQFKNCTASISSGSSSGGGGAYMVNHGTNLTIKNCLFVGNKQLFTDSQTPSRTTAIGGGCIASTGNNTAKLTIINSTFADNSSLARGGSVFIGHPTTLINCTFAGNSAAQGGGFYYHNANPVKIVNCIFTHNYSLDEGYVSQADLSRGGSPTDIIFAYSIVGATNFSLEGLTRVDAYLETMPLFASYRTNDTGKQVPVLADNGGLFQTAALASNGIATATGIGSFAGLEIPTTDQRGYTRGTPPSIGAFEYGATSTIELQKIVSGGIIASGDQILLAAGTKRSINVYNLTGKVVYSATVNGGEVISLPKGAYIVKLTESTGISSVSKVLLK